MKYYIDFDGVILDTEKLIFENWHKEEDKRLKFVICKEYLGVKL